MKSIVSLVLILELNFVLGNINLGLEAWKTLSDRIEAKLDNLELKQSSNEETTDSIKEIQTLVQGIKHYVAVNKNQNEFIKESEKRINSLKSSQESYYEVTTLVPFEWNEFLNQVQSNITYIQGRKDAIEADLGNATKYVDDFREMDQLITKTIKLQDMIDKEFAARANLSKEQVPILDNYKNKALRLRQELNALYEKLRILIIGGLKK